MVRISALPRLHRGPRFPHLHRTHSIPPAFNPRLHTIPGHTTMQQQFEPLKNDLLLRAARGN